MTKYYSPHLAELDEHTADMMQKYFDKELRILGKHNEFALRVAVPSQPSKPLIHSSYGLNVPGFGYCTNIEVTQCGFASRPSWEWPIPKLDDDYINGILATVDPVTKHESEYWPDDERLQPITIVEPKQARVGF